MHTCSMYAYVNEYVCMYVCMYMYIHTYIHVLFEEKGTKENMFSAAPSDAEAPRQVEHV
jgi:hypothetical protein